MIPIIELKIDPEFRDKIPPLTDAEFEQLRENILADGEVYEPICSSPTSGKRSTGCTKNSLADGTSPMSRGLF